MESKKVEMGEATPSNTAILDAPSRDDMLPSNTKYDGNKKVDADASDVYPSGGSGKLDPALKKRVLKGTILNWIFGLIAYGIALGLFIPMFLHVVDLYHNNTPDVESTAAVLKGRLRDLTGKTDEQLANGFADNLGSVFVNGAYDETDTEVLTQQTTGALGMLSESLPVETAMAQLVPLSKIAKFTANGDRGVALSRVAGAVKGVVGDPTAFMDRIRLAMAGLASYTADKDEAAALVPRALGGAMYQSFEVDAKDLVTEVSASFLDAAREQSLDEMFTFTWIALLITWVLVLVTALMVWYCRKEPELAMYNHHFKRHWFIAGLLLAPVGIYYVSIPTFQITYNTSTVKNLYLSAACLTSFVAVLGFSAPLVWMARSWYKDCNRSRGGCMNNYFVMAPWHLALTLLICGFHVWCYFDETCTIAMDYIPIFFTVAMIGLEFSFYAAWVMLKCHRQDYYAGFWPAGRMLGIFFVTFLVGYIYSATQNSKMFTAPMIVSHLNMIVFGATIDFFWLPIVKALGRKFRSSGKATFNDCDIVTLPTEGQLLDDGSGKPIVV